MLKNSDILYQYDNYILLFKRPGIYTIRSTLYDNIEPLIIHVEKPLTGVKYYSELKKNIKNIMNIIKNIFKK